MTTEERQRRIVAARLLRGIDQDKLAALGHKEGLGKQELARLERGEFGDRFTAVQCLALSRILGVPEGWFTEDDVDVIVNRAAGSALPQQVAAVAANQAGVIHAINRLRAAVLGLATDNLQREQMRRALDETDRPGESPGGDGQ